jgi:hypothetical protein
MPSRTAASLADPTPKSSLTYLSVVSFLRSWIHVRRGFAVLLAALIGMGLGFAHAKTGNYRIALLHVTYSDTTAIYTPAQLSQAAGEINNYYGLVSYGKLNMTVVPVEVTLPHPSTFYFNACQPAPMEKRDPCPPTLIEDAAQAAAAGGFSFSGIDGISVLSTFCGGDWTNGPLMISRPGVSGTFQRSYDFECSGPAPGPSGVLWGGWSHEFGHQLESTDYGTLWHPSGYASGYDEMDSCYPCDGSAYTLLGPPVANGSELIFGGWLDTGNVSIVNGPSPGTTVTLTPIEDNPATQAYQAIQVPIASGIYYMVEARHRLGADLLQNNGVAPRGIYDEGIHITEIEETRDPPMKIMNACDTTVPGGCVNSTSDPRYANCNPPTTRPAYCWPFALWHVGDEFSDPTNAIKIKVDSAVGDGYSVTVTRGVPPSHPNMFIVPWLTPPMNTYETVDIWVDSSCNGYESDVGPSGLLYGRRADNTVIGNGDDPCANHENRVYATVHNVGDVAANNIVVKFRVSNPLGVGVTGSWTDIGQTKIPSLAAGASTTVYVLWTPNVTLTPAEIAAGHFKFHSCIQAIIEPVTGEIVTSDNQAQENFDSFEAVQGKKKKYAPIHGQFFVHTLDAGGPATTFYLNVKSALPKGWTYSVAGGRQAVTLGAARTVQVPVDIQAPDGAPIGQTYMLSAQALTLERITNDLIPNGWNVSRTHNDMDLAGGVILAARTVLPSALSLAATASKTGVITATGVLDPTISTWVAVDFTDRNGNVYTRLAKTDSKGHYVCAFESPIRDAGWHLRALWQGDISHTGAVSPVRTVVSLIGNPNEHPPRTGNCK